jgi:hypothetical protein
VCERTGSLLDPESSLIGRKSSLFAFWKFPVRLRREFAEKVLVEPALFGVRSSRSGPKIAKFLVFTLFNRESDRREQFVSDCITRTHVGRKPLSPPPGWRPERNPRECPWSAAEKLRGALKKSKHVQIRNMTRVQRMQ